MSLAEIKEKVRALTPEQRLELSHLLFHLELQEDPEYLAEMNRRMAEMDAGKRYTLEQVEQMLRESPVQAGT